MRICSFVPSATEIVYALGLGDQLVGVTHECVYPPAAAAKPKLISTVIDQDRLSSREIDAAVREAIQTGRSLYRVDEAALRDARPDLIITQSLCEICAIDTAVVARALSVLPSTPEILTLHPHTLEEILADVGRVGDAAGCRAEAARVVAGLRERLARVQALVGASPAPGVVCLEWLEPLMGSGHWVPEQVAWAGGRELLGQAGVPSRYVTEEQVAAAAPDVAVLMPCGFPLPRIEAELGHVLEAPWWAALPAARTGRVFVVDGPAYFNCSGPRVVDGVELLAGLLHPVRCGALGPAGGARRLNPSGALAKSGGTG